MAHPTVYGPRTDWVGTRTIPFRCDAWGCPSLLVLTQLLAFVVIHNSDDPLAAGVNMHVLDLDRLAAASLTALIERLEQLALKFEKPVGVSTINRDVLFAQVSLTKLDHAEPGEAGDDDLHAHQSFHLGLRPEGSDRGEGSVERYFPKHIEGVRPQTRDHLSHHGVGKLLRKCSECCPQRGSVGIE